MSRLLGLSLALMFVVVGRSAHAQMPSSANGGFGFDYAQTIPSNTYVLDRWWWMQPTPVVESTLPPQTVMAPAAPTQPANPGRMTRAARPSRSFARMGTRPNGSPAALPGAPLPTGSLYWQATAGQPLYSPVQREAAYGQGYGVSPYGSADYGAQYKGLYWGY